MRGAELLLVATPVLPLVGAVLVLTRRTRQVGLALAPWAALPALGLVAVARPGWEMELPWVLLGLRLGVDELGWSWLLFTALLWLAAGVYASGYLARSGERHRFFALFLLAMAGNLGLVLAREAVGLYAFYALMSFSTYGLVLYQGGAEAARAARVYMVLVVVSEVLVVVGLVAAVSLAGGSGLEVLATGLGREPGVALACLLAGFGVKVGVLGLHVWLPLAHSLAPTPASAVLSGTMLKAGLLGWLRVFPLGGVRLAGWGALLVALGLMAAFIGVALGLAQRRPKAVLAYSSVSQMGFLTVGVGLALGAAPGAAQALPAVALYALHHGLVKGGLFLGVGVAQAASGRWQRRWVGLGFAVLGLSLAGAPLTSGALAKVALKGAAGEGLSLLLSVAAAGTTLLVVRLLWQVVAAPPEPITPGGVRLWAPWAALIVLSFSLAWGLAPRGVVARALSWSYAWAALWPVLLGALGAWAAWAVGQRTGARLPEVPVGDVGLLAVRAAAQARAALRAHGTQARWAPPAWWSAAKDLLRERLLAPGPPDVEVYASNWRALEWALLLLACLLLSLLAGG